MGEKIGVFANGVNSTGALIAQYQYTTGKSGERTKIQEEGPAGKKETEYDYDGAGRLTGEHTVSADSTGKETETSYAYEYDSAGELSRTLAETDGKGELLASYGWGDTLSSQTREGKTSDHLYDGQGNVRGLLDEKGNLTDTYAYNAYGELTAKTGETENHYLYTGEYYDGVSGLYYLRARYMNPETGTFTSMDTWQGDMYEPVTLHKYLYANANPVKYKDPSGNMGSLQECNLVSAISAELYKNQNVIMGMAVLNGIGKSVMTGLCGGDAGDMTEAFLEGVIEGAAMGMLFCAVAAVLATSMLTVMMAHTAASSVVFIVLAIYSVSEGDYLNALVYGAVAVAGIIGVCRWYKVTYQIDYVGEKGIARFAGGENLETKNPLADIQYTDKVKSQMELGDYHSFSKYVDRFGANGNITNIIGGDGIVRIKVEIPGSYRGRDGVFQYIIEPNGSTCNHRLFVTK